MTDSFVPPGGPPPEATPIPPAPAGAPPAMAAGMSPYPVHARPGPPPWHQPRPSKAMAGWALGLSLVPSLITTVLAVVFACVVLRQARDGRDHGKGMAIAALCIVPVWITVFAAVLVGLALAPASDNGDLAADNDSSSFESSSPRRNMVRWAELEPGDCFREPRTGKTFYFLEKRPCSNRKASEVYAVFQQAGRDDYPGDAAVGKRADAGCQRRYERHLERKPDAPQYAYGYFYPVKDAWEDYGDRTTICYFIRTGDDAPPTEQQPA